jgi:hypothetical protein
MDGAELVSWGIAGVLIVAVFGAVAAGGVFSAQLGDNTDDVEVLGGSGTIGDAGYTDELSNVSARSTLGDAVYLQAGDSSVASSADYELGDGFSVCSWAALDPAAAGSGGNYSLVGAETDRYSVRLVYNDSQDRYTGWYYDRSERLAQQASIDAVDVTNSSLVCATRVNDTGFFVSRNTSVGAVADPGNATDQARPPAADWHGTLEETRLYDYGLNVSQRQEWVGEPVLAVNGSAPVARLSYDTRSATVSEVPVYFTDATATYQNAQRVDGFGGPDFDNGTDYRVGGGLLSGGNELVVVDGGELDDNGEVVYTTFDVDAAGGGLITLGFGLFFLAFAAPKLLDALEEL